MQAGDEVDSGRSLARRTYRRLNPVGALSNSVGALVVFLYTGFLIPRSDEVGDIGDLTVRNAIFLAAFLAVAMPAGYYFAQRRPFAPLWRWLSSGRPATDFERLAVLRYPATWATSAAVLWGIGAVLSFFVNLNVDVGVAATFLSTAALGGVTACALQYLLVERIMRPVTGRALAGGAPPLGAAPGVAARLTMAWALATGAPLLGIVAIGVVELIHTDLTASQILGAIVSLGGIAVVVGLMAMLFAARSVADPVTAVERAQESVERGDLETRVAVDDGSEVGRLQAGFNRMVAGLQERERLREAFGAFVDPVLTERVLEEGTDLAGEEVDLSVMFIDVRDFTTFAEQAQAHEVVARLNELYDLIVPIILRHEGHASKFIGDGLLAVFGAPERLPDHAARAVAAAYEIAAAVSERFGDELRVGIGVNSGRVVAGTIGGGGRVDFTVIGDPVNTAARVEAATRQTGDDILITEATLAQLDGRREDWEERPAIPLKGKRETIALFAPRAAARAAR